MEENYKDKIRKLIFGYGEKVDDDVVNFVYDNIFLCLIKNLKKFEKREDLLQNLKTGPKEIYTNITVFNQKIKQFKSL